MMRMKRGMRAVRVGALTMGIALLWGATAPAMAAPVLDISVPPGLSFSQIKITGSEFLVLRNNTSATLPDLSAYWLDAYNNVNPLAAGVE